MVIRIISNYFLQKINTDNFTPIKFKCPFKYINTTYLPITYLPITNLPITNPPITNQSTNIGSTIQKDDMYRIKYFIQ